MKSEQEIREARSFVVRALLKVNPSTRCEQRAVLEGMSVALQWVCGEGDSTLERLLAGEPLKGECKR